MSIHLSYHGPRGHIARHTGRPTGHVHVSRHTGRPIGHVHVLRRSERFSHHRHQPKVVLHGHISRHSGRHTGRPHFHRRHHFHYYAKAQPVTVSGSALTIALGALSLITGIALIALGALTFNPILIGVGAGFTGLGVLAIGGAATYLSVHHSKYKKEQNTQEPAPTKIATPEW